MIPLGYDVAAYLDRNGDAATVDLADKHLPIVTAMVRAYVRDRGFTGAEPGDDLAAVIIASCARLTDNPSMIPERATAIDDYSETVKRAVFTGWTLPELAILHRHRKRAL